MIGCLVIHGYTGGPYELEPLTDFLKEKTNWIIQVPILPGHGKNLSLEDKTYDEWLDAAEHALHQMREKCNEIYVIGFSMGGMIAAYLAAKHHVDKLVLLAPAGKYLSFKHLFAEVTDMLKDAVRGKINKNRFYLHYKRKWGTIPLRANIEFMKLIHATKKYLKSVQSPVLIAQGQLDSMVPYKTAYYLDKEIASNEKEVIFFEKSKHLICHGSDQEVLIKMVHQFLTKT